MEGRGLIIAGALKPEPEGSSESAQKCVSAGILHRRKAFVVDSLWRTVAEVPLLSVTDRIVVAHHDKPHLTPNLLRVDTNAWNHYSFHILTLPLLFRGVYLPIFLTRSHAMRITTGRAINPKVMIFLFIVQFLVYQTKQPLGRWAFRICYTGYESLQNGR